MGKYEEVLEEGRGPRVLGPGVPRSQGPKDQDISNSHSNTSLTLKKVHLVVHIINIALKLHHMLIGFYIKVYFIQI